MNKYVLSDLIGEGSFGKVYKAVEKASGDTVAIKIINKRGRSGRELKGLRGECEIQRNLKHPNIIRMLDSFETHNEIVVVTEYAKTDLHSLLRAGSLEEQKTQRITFNLVSALYYLHSHRILHRDLKPQNILLDRKMCAKLCDFGFARNMTMGTHVLTSIKGTPLYMAPELLEAKPYDHHADLWSLGCIIYEMLAGEPPFSSTSMIHLVRLIRNQYIKWPSYLTSNCISFIQGLLERDPIKRMSWATILQHPFVKGHILTLDENNPQSPFTHSLTASQSRENNNQLTNIIESTKIWQNISNEEDLTTSKDSIKVILQSDFEYQETDTDDCATNIPLENCLFSSLSNAANRNETVYGKSVYDMTADEQKVKKIQLLENPNLIVNCFNDNFPIIRLRPPLPLASVTVPNSDFSQLQTSREYVKQHVRSQELGMRKLSQSIDNFSMRIESELQATKRNSIALGMSYISITTKEEEQKRIEKNTPSLLPGWDSCDESQNPPIENEEWLAFLQRSIQEVLDGELESLKQQNFVCIIVAPLRNRRASAKVVENVAHLLSLPLTINTPPTILRDIVNVYGELKLVPNLVYASKLLCNKLYYEDSSTSESQPGIKPSRQSICSIRQLSALDNDEIKTLIAVYDLMCYLIHMGDIFLNQFCDAIEILGAKELFVNLIAVVHVNEAYVRLVCSLLALLNCALRELPENAEIIEQIIFHENVNFMTLLKHDNAVLRLRTCMLLRILARFSCLALQKRWTIDIKHNLEKAPHFRGLVNQAMTCYLNSLLQGLYMTPEFRNALYNWEFDGEDEAKSIPYQLQKLFVNLQTSPKSAVETTDLTRSFGWDSAEGWQQHDIQELCRVMFDALEHKFKRTEEADLINRLYQGHMIDYVRCLECNTEKQREDKFLDIPLPVRPFGSTVANECVEDALQGFVKPEILNESNQYFCDTCNKKCDAHKGLKFTKFPYILTLHLKRFDFDYQSFHRIKLNDKVTFPELLNLNHFVSSTPTLTTSTIAAAAAAAAAAASTTNGTANGNGPMMMETAENFMKSDECSTTDSGSALEEDSFQNGGTSVSSTTTTPNDQFMAQDDDEGIDMDLTTNGDSKSSPVNNSFNAPGPYKYELFAIMIHAGSASGGHYYAYIKDFKSGRWFSFNDQTVLPITQEDIHKSYGGGSYKTSYTGAYTSSTNAYMLMYRQIDSEKNALPISEEQFPDHIKRLVMKIRANEGNHSRDHLDMTRLTVAYENPRTRTIKGHKMAVFTSSTLAETVQEAVRVLHLKGTVPVERCRLVGYDCNARTIERSFEGHEEKTIDEVMRMLKRCDSLLLEVREEGETFEEYQVQGVMTKVYKVDVNGRDVEGPVSIRANLSQTVAQYRAIIARKLKLNPKAILVGMTVHKESAKLLQTDDATLEDEHFIEYCKVFVTVAPTAGDDREQYGARFRHFIQRLDHLVSFYIVLPNMDPDTLESLSIPRLSKETLAAIAAADSPMAGGTGDSNSEDSSLSDNDRTLVEDDFVHIKLNGDLHLTNGGSSGAGAMSNGAAAKGSSKATATTPTSASNGFKSDDEEEDEDAKLAEMLQECRAQEYYFKVTPLNTASSSSNGASNGSSADDSTRSHSTDSGSQKLVQVLIDKRSCNAYLKYRLQSYLQISMDYFKVFSSDALCPTNDSANLLKELEYKDDDRLALELGRVLRKGEYKLNVSYVNVNQMTEEMDNTPSLCSTIVKNGDLVGQIKADILASLPAALGEGAKKYAHLHSNNCRLRRKGIKYLSTLYKDDERIGTDITLPTNADVFLQEVDDLASLTPIDINDVVLLVRRWHPSEMKLGKFQEILFTDKLELTKHLSRISGIPEENIEYVKIPQTTLHRDSVLNIQNGLHWVSTPQHADDCQVYSVGTLLYYRDSTEQLKELTPEERKELTKKDNRTSSTYSPRKERALKIYLDASPKKADD